MAAVRSDADVLFVVDTTGSWRAEDYDGANPRLDGMRADMLGSSASSPALTSG